MAINVDVRIRRLVPNENPDATVLMIVDKEDNGGVVIRNEYNDQNIFKVKSAEDIIKYFQPNVGKQELLEMLYLTQAGMQVLVIQPEEGLDSLTEDEVEKLAEDYNFRFVVYGNKILDEVANLDENAVDLIKKVDAEMFIQVNTDAVITEQEMKLISNPKISVFANTGKVGMPTKVGELDLVEEMETVGIPISLAVVVRKSKLIQENEPHTPVAGYTTGRLTEFIEINKQLGNIQRKKLQAVGINPAVLRAGVGTVIVAQNTSLFAKDKDSPLAKGHITTLTIDFKRKLKELAEETLHKLNNVKTWNLVKMGASQIFELILLAGGIEDYTVQVGLGETMTEEDVKNGKLILHTTFIPTYAIEEITVTVTIIEDEDGFLIETDGGI